MSVSQLSVPAFAAEGTKSVSIAGSTYTYSAEALEGYTQIGNSGLYYKLTNGTGFSGTIYGTSNLTYKEFYSGADLTAEENLLLYAKLYGVADPQKRVIELLDAVGLKHRRLDRVRTFSRGMTQRVSIARALVNDPSVVLLDEPYSGLDPHAMHIFDELIASVREDRTFVMVSHDLDKGLALASHVLVLARGRVVHFGEKDQIEPRRVRRPVPHHRRDGGELDGTRIGIPRG